VVMRVNGLSKSSLMGVGNRMVLYTKNPRFYSSYPFIWPLFMFSNQPLSFSLFLGKTKRSSGNELLHLGLL